MADSVLFIGPGRMGLALGHALWEADAVGSLTYCGRRPEPPAHPLFVQGSAEYVFGLQRPVPGTTAIFLSVPDEVLPEISVALAAHGEAPVGCVAFHLSGALGTDPLAPLHGRGYEVGTFHPFQTVAEPVRGASLLAGALFAISGSPGTLAVARRFAHALGSRTVGVAVPSRPLYHASAVFASNYLLGLIAAGVRLMERAGVPPETSLEAILHLARGTLENVRDLEPVGALTGPIARGDVETVRMHLRRLEPKERSLYAVLGLEVLDLAREAGLDENPAGELREILERER